MGIQHPRVPGSAIAGVDIVDAAVATSGDYERYMEIDGKRYCHILDARTGMPVDHWQSVSVVAPLCVAAGSCATDRDVAGAGGPAFLEGQGVRWIGVTAEGRLMGDAAAA